MPVDANVSCSTASVPNIVASGSLTSQTSDLVGHTLFTPSSTGLFRISLYMNGTTGLGVDPAVSFTDETGSRGIGAGTLSAPLGYVFVVRCLSGDAISFSTNSGGGTLNYGVYYTVEQLQ